MHAQQGPSIWREISMRIETEIEPVHRVLSTIYYTWIIKRALVLSMIFALTTIYSLLYLTVNIVHGPRVTEILRPPPSNVLKFYF